MPSTTPGKRGRPAGLDHWRVTTPYEHLAKQVADLYGGQVVAWTDGPRAGEWLVDTQVRELAIYLPPSPLGNTPVYELWDGQQMVRTCSGAELPAAGGPGGGCWTTLPTGPDGPEEVESNCLCREAGELACKPTTRLDVVLAGVDFAGVWRLVTHSDFAREELPGMVEALAAVAARGFANGYLCLTNRASTGRDGVRHKYQVPTLRLPTSLESLAAGDGFLQGLPREAVTAPALPPPRPPDTLVVAAPIPRQEAQDTAEALRALGYDDDERQRLVHDVTGGRTQYVSELYEDELAALWTAAGLADEEG